VAILKRLFIPVFFLVFVPFSNLQSQVGKNLFIEAGYHYGFLWQHSPSMADIAGGKISAFDISLGQKTYGKSYWDQLYRYPDRGFGYSFYYLGNPQQLGRANSLFYYFRIPLIKKRKFSLNYKISGGLAHLEQENIAIGTHLNLYFNACVDTKLRIGKKIELINAFGATHFSNGAIKMPNLGVNLFTYSIGLTYQLHNTLNDKIVQELQPICKRNVISTVISAGTKEKRPNGEISYSVASVSVDYLYQLSHKHKIGSGIDVFYDESMYELMNPDSSLSLNRTDIMRYGWHLSLETQIYRIVLGIHLGTYLHAKYTTDGRIYQRIALRYLVSKNLFANISLKTSKGVADFVEWGFGYQFRFK
jgi:hypothetical protein